MAKPAHELSGRRGARSHVKPLIRPSWLPESVWPFQTFGIGVDDTMIAFTDVGDHDCPALLFVHTGMWSFIWRDVISRLATDFRCIALDAPGTGQSSPMPASSITLENSARAVNGLIEGLELENLTLVVHDLGGPAGLAGAARTPERVRGIVAINAFGWKPAGALFRGMLALMGSAPVREFDVMTGFIPRLTATNFGVGRHFDRASRDTFRAALGHDGRRAFHRYLNDARSCDELYARISSALAGPFAKLPLLTIFGERNDPLGFQPRWKQIFPNARQLVVAKGNHFPMCDDPDLVANAIRTWHAEHVKS